MQGASVPCYAITTAETIFHPQGGGQPADVGIISSTEDAESDVTSFQVEAVRRAAERRILHFGRFVSSPPRTGFREGEKVRQEIDGERRFLHSRLHTAGHVLGLAVRSLTGDIPDITEVKASHFPGAAFVEFRGSIDSKQKDAIQAQVDKFVGQALPVRVCWWGEDELKEKCTAVPEGFRLAGSELGRVVEIEGIGAYPCGGTHVADSSLIGKVIVRKISKSKGISKVSYEVA